MPGIAIIAWNPYTVRVVPIASNTGHALLFIGTLRRWWGNIPNLIPIPTCATEGFVNLVGRTTPLVSSTILTPLLAFKGISTLQRKCFRTLCGDPVGNLRARKEREDAIESKHRIRSLGSHRVRGCPRLHLLFELYDESGRGEVSVTSRRVPSKQGHGIDRTTAGWELTTAEPTWPRRAGTPACSPEREKR